MILDIYKDALEYSAKDIKVLLILGLCYFLSFLLLPVFLIYGYSYRVTKISVEGMINGNDPLPEFDNAIDMFVDGIKVVLIFLIYSLLPIIIFFLFAFLSSAIGGFAESVIMAIGIVITIVAFILAYVMSMMGIAHMASNGDSLSKAFDFNEIIEIINSIGLGKCIGTYLGLIAIAFAIYVVVFLLLMLVFGFFGIFTGVLGLGFAALGIFLIGILLINLVMMFIVGPYTNLMQSRTCGLLYNLH